ncbi:Glutathione hydrolase proenzyme OS=Afipia felis OX=1035 GN=ggt PE=3 SV=1 [Afipia felis]
MTEILKGGVTASSEAAAEAGAAILRSGGNAVDAAVATALASCVADPCNTGIGGFGGHMVIARSGADPVCIDFGPWLPAHSSEQRTRSQTKFGPGASVVPNVVAGLARALKGHGSKSWSEISAPAIALARNGVVLNSTLKRAFSEVEDASFVQDCFSFGQARPGDESSAQVMYQPKLAATLEEIAKRGPEWLYEGPIGDRACEVFQNSGYEVARKEWAEAPQSITESPAPSFEIAGQSFYSAPLARSGSPSLFATVAAGCKLSGDNLELPATMAAWAGMIASSWAFRFGTPDGNDFRSVSTQEWVGKALAFQERRELPENIGHTCHLNAADRHGTLVAMTLTHGPFWFGGRWAIPDAGIIMNAGMPLFSGAPAVMSGERALGVTNMAPTVARLRNGATIAIGCPGARRIPTIIGLVLGRHLFGSMPLQRAVSAVRFHAETNLSASIERDRASEAVVEAFRGKFAKVNSEVAESYYGPLTAIRREMDGHIGFGLDDRWKGTGLSA